MTFTQATIATAWQQALAVWDAGVTLSPPEPWDKAGKRADGSEPLAYLDLEKRQVVVSFSQLEAIGAEASLAAVLAHEVGHHVRYPHTLGLAAALEAIEHRLIPGLKQSLTNLFFDLLVNEVVGRTRADELCAVYQGFLRKSKTVDPAFFFYVAIYEELWGREPGFLVPAAQIEEMEKTHPGCRADARIFTQTFYALPDIYLQFVYFCSRFIFYIPDPKAFESHDPFEGDVPEPDIDDYDGAAQGNAQAEAALEEARERGWIEGGAAAAANDPLANLGRLLSRAQGRGGAAFREALVSRHYKRLVDNHIIKLPAVTPPPEPFLMTVTEDWEWGENPRAIDWTASILTQGALAGARPLRRDLEADPPQPQEGDFPAVEIYLDTSGSMPNPSTGLNAMTLAAQILSASAIRKRGTVRGIVYSDGNPQVSPWMHDEELARRFLLQYAAGGTDFPFPVLRKHADQRQDVLRVVVSDDGFLWNLQAKGAPDTFQHALERSQLVVLFLLLWGSPQLSKEIKALTTHERCRLVVVKNAGALAEAATALARGLFGEQA